MPLGLEEAGLDDVALRVCFSPRASSHISYLLQQLWEQAYWVSISWHIVVVVVACGVGVCYGVFLSGFV